MFTSGAEIADYVLLLARPDPEDPKHKGLTMFIVPLKSAGVTIHPVHTFQEERTNVTFYDAVCIPDSYRLGDVGGGLRVLVSSLEIEHAMTCVKEHGNLLAAAERFCRATSRGRGKMIDDSAVQLRLARAAANVAAAQVLNFRALWVAEEGKADQAQGPASKMFSSEVYRADACDLLNLTAPESLAFASRDAAYINWCYRHSQVATVYGGTSEIHRSMVAERALGLPRTRD
jgi:3-oxochol-4-en-24-oyl-CoA dehydrogenase